VGREAWSAQRHVHCVPERLMISVENLIGFIGRIAFVACLFIAPIHPCVVLGSWHGLCGRFAAVYGGHQVGREVWSAR
jgi:hypothetical protein